MTTTEAPTLASLYARYREIAPYPDPEAKDPSKALAVHLLVHAQRDYTRMLSPAEPFDHALISGVCVRFAAVHLLTWLRREQPEIAGRLAGQIVSAWDDGGSIGEWLWEHAQPLGVDPAAVQQLAEAEAVLQGAKQADAEQAATDMAKALASKADMVQALGRIVSEMSAGLYAAWINLQRGDSGAVLRWIEEMPADLRDRDPETTWNGTETGCEWLARTQAKPEPAI